MISTQPEVSPRVTAPAKRRGRKRADGEGSIGAYKDGWRGRLMVGYKADGKPDVREVYAKTQSEVRQKLQELRGRQQHGTLIAASKDRDTLAGFVARWLEATRASVRPSTHKRYTELLTLHVLPTLGKVRLTKLQPDDLQRLYSRLLTAPAVRPRGSALTLSARTVHHVHVVLHTALEQAVRWGNVGRNVSEMVTPPRVATPELHVPSLADVRALLSAAADDPWLPLWTLAFYTGARQGELLALQWTDVDLEHGTLSVRRSLQAVRAGQPTYGEPKTRRSRRTITVPPEAVSALSAHRQRQLERRVLLGPEYAPHNLIFADPTGGALWHSTVLRAFRVALARAELPATTRFHDIRHAAATLMLAADVPLKIASERLGHSTVGITADLYTHNVPKLEADAALRLERLIRGPGAG
jgi:integrase